MKKHDITMTELKKLLPSVLIFNGIVLVIMIIAFICTMSFDIGLILGLVYGNAIALGNFFTLGRCVENSLKRSSKEAQFFMNTSYIVRYLGMFFLLAAAVYIPFISVYTTLIPLLFPRFAIMLRTLLLKKED